jgi:RecB family exonuclease
MTTTPRDSNYVWVTWLAKLMLGDVQCTWSSWFKTHFTGYPKMPSTFDLVQFTMDHNALVQEIARERRALGERVLIESQNSFNVKLSPTVTLGGKPDVVTIAADGTVRVFDAKTGSPKASDQVQMMLYLLCLPSKFPQYKGKLVEGCLVYASGERAEVPITRLTADFKTSARSSVNMLDTDVEPGRVPSADECRYCDITGADCADRIDTFSNGDTPDLDW